MRGQRWGITGAVIAVVTLFAACEGGGDMAPVAVGAPVPEFAAPTLAGDTVALADLRGEHVLLNVWATWCVPCREEMPDLQEMQDEFGPSGLQVVGVSIDQGYGRRDIETFLEQHAIDFMILHDSEGRIARTFRTIGVPETFLIGPDGTLEARWFGQIDPAAVRQTIDAAL